jgi:hypothetical protein
MGHAALTDGYTANGVFLASLDPFATESATPIGRAAGCLILARLQRTMLMACYFPQRRLRPFFDRCLELAREHQAAPFVLVGDLNTGNQLADRSEGAGKYYCAAHFDRLVSVAGCRISGGSRMAPAASGPGTPPTAMAFGSTTP